MIKRLLRGLLHRWLRSLAPPPDLSTENAVLRDLVKNLRPEESQSLSEYMDIARELIDARLMQGAGPWQAPSRKMLRQGQEALVRIRERAVGLKESNPITAQGAFGDIELALQNVEWRREINLSWLEFSRWGIQQIILISRLYYIKNPLIRRGIDVSAAYVFARGFEVTSSDPDANDVLKDFIDRNQAVFGHVAMVENERKKYYDGNLFFALFADKADSGSVECRLIDATEIQDIVTDEEDSSTPQLYKRVWTQRSFNMATGSTSLRSMEEWYPALGYDPPQKLETIGGKVVHWDVQVYHRRCGHVAKWLFGCPIVYPALDWAKAARKFLESVATIKQAHSQIAWSFTTKGGQVALEAAKQQLQTTVNSGPNLSLWDSNPTPVNASVFASGPGSSISALTQRGKSDDPDEVRPFIRWVAMIFGIPETFFSDTAIGQLATATSLDRPTELNFLEKQEAWREDLIVISKFVLSTSAKAPAGKLKEKRGAGVLIMEARRTSDGKLYEKAKPKDDEVQIRVTFPAIREGDAPAIVKAIAEAMTLDNKGGQIVGIDEKTGVLLLLETLGVEDAADLVELMYPDTGKDKYDPNRTKEPLPAPIGKAEPDPGGMPQAPGGIDPKPADKQVAAAERLLEAVNSLRDARAQRRGA